MPVPEPKPEGAQPPGGRDESRAIADELITEVENLHPLVIVGHVDGEEVLSRARIVLSLAEQLAHQQRVGRGAGGDPKSP